MKFDIQKLEKKIKININNKSLFIDALTHKSANKLKNNEKLEFLGDRVIGLVLSERLYELYPNLDEGTLDKRFARLVNRKSCAEVAWSLGINDFIRMGDVKKKINIKDEKILSDSCEAVVGAVFIDCGYLLAKKFVLDIWKEHIKKSRVTILDSKTKLQEYSLKLYKKLPIYKLLSHKGPRHTPIFKISVKIEKTKSYVGIGNSKKNAEQDAAHKLLKSINIF
tara:strand:+ start:353 stop:1021 length:669 start_codon:yes stop_codon:yes gene_type:complete